MYEYCWAAQKDHCKIIAKYIIASIKRIKRAIIICFNQIASRQLFWKMFSVTKTYIFVTKDLCHNDMIYSIAYQHLWVIFFHFIFNFVENFTFRTTLSKWLQLKYFSRRPQLEMHCKANSKREDLPQKINRLASRGFTKSQQQTLMHSWIDSTLKYFESWPYIWNWGRSLWNFGPIFIYLALSYMLFILFNQKLFVFILPMILFFKRACAYRVKNTAT